MPRFDTKRDVRPIKALYLGHSGDGKTGSLCSLAAAGYNLRVLSTDGDPEIITGYLTDQNSIYRQAKPGLWTQEQADSVLERASYLICTEEYNLLGTRAMPRATAWNRLNQTLNNWTDQDQKLGNISKWSPDDVLVIDSFSRVCDAAMNFQLSLNGRLDKGPQVGTSGSNDYTAAFRLIEQWLDFLKCDEVKCNVILVCHIQFTTEVTNPQAPQAARGDVKGFPQAVGRAIAPKIGQYFNHALRAKQIGTGQATKRFIVTNNDEHISLKNPAPLKVKEQYDLSTGLAEYFQAIRGPFQSVLPEKRTSAPSGSGQHQGDQPN